MNNKKKFAIVGTVFISLLSFLPIESFSAYTNNNAEDDGVFGLYIAGQYKPSVSNFSGFSVKETNFETKKLVRIKDGATATGSASGSDSLLTTYTNFEGLYTAKFKDNAISFGGIVGYSYKEGLRLEIEGSYEKFDVKNTGNCSVKDAYRYFALARDMDTSSSNSPSSKKYAVMKNNGLSITSVMINGCYDFSLDDLAVSPYICAGVGENFIEFFDALSIKFAYQGKLGVNYSLSPQISLFADGYYHKVIGNQFKNLNVHHVVELEQFPKSTSAVATLNIEYFGGEIGVRFIF